MIELVIFDFDGTLVDTAPDLVAATNAFLKSKGAPPLPESRIREEIGMGLRKLILDVYPDSHLSEPAQRAIAEEFMQLYQTMYLNSPRLFDGALEFLNEWEGSKAIVSNKREQFIGPILKKLGAADIGWTSIIGGDTFPHMKPHPTPFLAAIQAADATPETTLIVGDGHPDILGALAIGSRSVAVEFGYTSAPELMGLGADYSLASFEDLEALIAKINRETPRPIA